VNLIPESCKKWRTNKTHKMSNAEKSEQCPFRFKRKCCLLRECVATVHGTTTHTDCLIPRLDSTTKHHSLRSTNSSKQASTHDEHSTATFNQIHSTNGATFLPNCAVLVKFLNFCGISKTNHNWGKSNLVKKLTAMLSALLSASSSSQCHQIQSHDTQPKIT